MDEPPPYELILLEPYTDNVLPFQFESIKEAYFFVQGLRQGIRFSIPTDYYDVLDTNLPDFPDRIAPPTEPINY